MTPDQWQQVKTLFHEATDLPPDARPAFLKRRCAGDSELQHELQLLLASHEQAEQFIEHPAVAPVSEILSNEGDPWKDRAIGNYRVLGEIGRGGMGLVLLAVRADDQFDQRVAIKVLRRGMDTEDILRRFRNERQILASLNHPNIASLHDGGTTDDGLPYFVMEHVEGLPLLRYVEEHNLSVKERLALFRRICSAVQHAHQHLIIHRDLKPSNILITTDGEVKLLDFGVAKLLNPEMTGGMTETQANLRVMTPEYASPEQVRGQHVSTATDIYSLGVVLYELLTGTRPYKLKDKSPEELSRAICDSEPSKPSDAVSRRWSVVSGNGQSAKGKEQSAELRSRNDGQRPNPQSAIRNPNFLKGDLDNIVLMALRKEPSRRYQSVEQFSEDIRRHLEGLPVIARPDTFAYRGSKFIQRHRVGVAAAALVALALIAGIVATTWQARVAREQRGRAEKRFNDVRRLANSFMFEIHDSVQDLPGSTPTRKLLVTRALEYLDSLARESGDDPSLQRELATAYEKVGDIQGNPYVGNLGDTDGALASYRKAIAIREGLGTKQRGVDAEVEFGRSYRSLGDILEQKGDIAGTIDAYRKSLAIFERLNQSNPNNSALLDELARAYEALGDGLGRSSDTAAQLQCYRKTLEIRQALLAAEPANKKIRRSTAIGYMKVGGAEGPTPASGEENIRKAIAILEDLSAGDPTNARARREVGFAYYLLGNLLTQAKDFQPALDARRKALIIREVFANADPKNAQAKFDLAVGYGDLAEALTNTGDFSQAQQNARHALSILETLAAADATNVVYRRNIGLCYEKIGDMNSKEAADEKRTVSRRVRQWAEARTWYQKGRDVFLQLRDRGSLMPVDAGQPDRFSSRMKECDEAMARLMPASRPSQ